ncbi:MAG: chromosomal replication initiator protein DnaA [Acetobacteraceae bacterium]
MKLEPAPATDAVASPEATTLSAQWARIHARLRAELSEADHRAWLQQVRLGRRDGDEVTLYLPTRFLRDWVSAEHGLRLADAWRAEDPTLRRVALRTAARVAPRAGRSEPEPMSPAAPVPATATEPSRLPELTAPLEPRFTFDNFVVGKPNEFAYACARRVASQPACQGFNPLFLHGGVGLGKTHLMHAIAWDLLTQAPPGTRPPSVAYMSAEGFMNRFVGALNAKSAIEFRHEMRGVDVLMIDDLQFLIGKDGTQEEFFHTFNGLVESGKQIVVSADKAPINMTAIEQRLRTRLSCGMVADIHSTTYELRLSILETKVKASGVDIPDKVLALLAHKITTSVRELEGALNRLIAEMRLFGRQITLETAQVLLQDQLRAHDRRVTIDEIQRKVAEHYNIRLSELLSPRRSRNIARPRQVAMYLAKQLTSRSLPEIGGKFGGRDHTTVLHAVRQVGDLMTRDVTLAEDVDLLRRMLES